MYHVSCNMCHVSGFTCYVSHVTWVIGSRKGHEPKPFFYYYFFKGTITSFSRVNMKMSAYCLGIQIKS